jgi:uncharacterized protein (UPF0179 family)
LIKIERGLDLSESEFITLLPKRIARGGYRYYIIKDEVCLDCRFKNICQGKLVERRVYEVVGKVKRERGHNKLFCKLTDTEVIPVKVRVAFIAVNLQSRRAKEGIKTRYGDLYCENYNCKFRRKCFPVGLNDNDKILVVKVQGSVECPQRHQLSSALVLPLLP